MAIYRPLADTDDCNLYWNGSAWTLNITGDFYVGSYSSTNYKRGGGVRFPAVAIPQGATITSAKLTITAYTDRAATTVNSKISGQDIDNAAQFSNLADYQARVHTTAVVNWNAIPAWTGNVEYDSPSITSIVQEIVDRVGWVSGNAMVIFWDDHDALSSTDACRLAYEYSASPAKSIALEVTYLVLSAELDDSLSIGESVSNIKSRSLSDGLSVTESLGRKNKFYRNLSDSVAFSDATVTEAVHYYQLPLSDSVSITESGIFILGLKQGEKSEWKFKIKNPSTGKFVATLTNARKRWFVERLNDEAEAGFILDADDSNATATILNLGVNELYVYYKGALKWSGQLVSAKKIARGNDIYWEVLVKDWVALLGKRYCGVESLREFTTTDAGQIAKTLIQETQALVNGSFGITYGTIEVSITRSPIYDKKNILEAIKELSNIGDDGSANYGFDFEITPLKVFNIYYPYKGTIREGVVFRYPGNCENFEAFVDSWGIVNHEWGLGRHWTGNTAVVSRSDATSQTTYKRREAIKNYKDMSVLEFLQDMVWQDIQWLKDPSTVARFESRVDAKTGIDDYNVGDGVTVVCDKFSIDEWLWIYERKIEIQENDELLVTLTVGD